MAMNDKAQQLFGKHLYLLYELICIHLVEMKAGVVFRA